MFGAEMQGEIERVHWVAELQGLALHDDDNWLDCLCTNNLLVLNLVNQGQHSDDEMLISMLLV